MGCPAHFFRCANPPIADGGSMQLAATDFGLSSVRDSLLRG